MNNIALLLSIVDLGYRCVVLNLHQVSLRFCVDQIKPFVHRTVFMVFAALFQLKKVYRQFIRENLVTRILHHAEMRVVIFTVEQIEIDQIDTHRSFQRAVFIAGFQLVAVEL